MEPKNLESLNSSARENFNRKLKASARIPVDQAIDLFREAISLDPSVMPLREHLRDLERRKTADLRSSGQLKATLLNFPTVIIAAITSLFKPFAAMDMCEKILAKNLNNTPALTVLAYAARRADALFISVDAMLAARYYNNKNCSILRKLGNYLLENKQAEEASKFFQELLLLRPKDQTVKALLRAALAAASLEQNSNIKEEEGEATVAKTMETAIQTRDSDDAVAQQLMEGTIRDADQAALVISKLTGILATRESLDIRRKLAEAYQVAGEYDLAIENLETVAAGLAAFDATLDKQIEKLYLIKYDQAIETLSANPDAYENGVEHLAQLQTERENFRLERAVSRSQAYPNDQQLHYDLGILYFDHARFAEAVEEFQKSKYNPQRKSMSLYYLGRSYAALEQYEPAIRKFTKCLDELSTRESYYKDCLYALAAVTEKSGDAAKAKELYKKLHEMDATFQDVAAKIA